MSTLDVGSSPCLLSCLCWLTLLQHAALLLPPPASSPQVIFCAAARSAFTGDLNRVDAGGVSNIATSLQDELFRRARGTGSKYSPAAKKEVADFGRVYHQLRWDVQFVGVMVSALTSGIAQHRGGTRHNKHPSAQCVGVWGGGGSGQQGRRAGMSWFELGSRCCELGSRCCDEMSVAGLSVAG